MMHKKWLLGSVLLFSLAGNAALAAVPAAEAARLGRDLTPFGAEKAGNGGDIPEWSGGLTKAPPGYKGSGQHHPDPFAADTVKFVIDAKNLDKYRKNLSDGVIALMNAYPTTFTLPVYASRRTHAAPDWVS